MTNWMTNWMSDWLTDWLVVCLTGWLSGRMTNWMSDWLAGCLPGRMTNWMSDWPNDWLVVCLRGWLPGRRTNWTTIFVMWLGSISCFKKTIYRAFYYKNLTYNTSFPIACFSGSCIFILFSWIIFFYLRRDSTHLNQLEASSEFCQSSLTFDIQCCF